MDKAIDCNRSQMFIDICIDWHLNINGMISFYFNGEEFDSSRIRRNSKINYTEKTIKIDIPDNCNYRNGNKCIVPLIKYKLCN